MKPTDLVPDERLHELADLYADAGREGVFEAVRAVRTDVALALRERSVVERVAAAICRERGDGEDVGNYDVGLAEAAIEAILR